MSTATPVNKTSRRAEKQADTSKGLSRIQVACDALETIAHSLGPDAQLPSVRDLRERLGISISTLDAALTELEQRKVIRRRQGSGIFVSRLLGQRNLALICEPSWTIDQSASPFWRQLIERMRQRADEGQERLSLYFTRSLSFQNDEDEAPTERRFEKEGYPYDSTLLQDDLARDVMERRLHGVIAVGLPHPVTRWIEFYGVPVVAFAGPANYIFSHLSEELVYLGVTELARRGCQRLGILAPVPPYRPKEDAWPYLNTLMATLTATGLPLYPELVDRHESLAMESYHTVSLQEQGYQTAMRWFGPQSDPARRPDGVLSTDDVQTQGFLTGLQQCGVRAGVDVQVASHANVGSPILLGYEDSLILLEYDTNEAVTQIFNLLELLMDGKTPEPVTLPEPLTTLVNHTVPEHREWIRPHLRPHPIS